MWETCIFDLNSNSDLDIVWESRVIFYWSKYNEKNTKTTTEKIRLRKWSCESKLTSKLKKWEKLFL